MNRIIAADIGGTSSRFALFESKEGRLKLITQQWFESDAVASFAELLTALPGSSLGLSVTDADILAIAAAGPVQRNGTYCAPPNNDWAIDLTTVPGNSLLINDFTAQAYACRSQLAEEAETLIDAPEGQGTVAVIGAGTGLGKAFIVPSDESYVVGASEGGHLAFPATTEQELACASFIANKEKAPYATWDMVVSGRGLSAIHEFLNSETLSAAEVSDKLDTASNTAEMFSKFYGRVCRDFALEVVASGGLYIAGGVAAKNKQLVQSEAFRREFLNSPVHNALLGKISVKLLANQDSGLWGAAYAGTADL